MKRRRRWKESKCLLAYSIQLETSPLLFSFYFPIASLLRKIPLKPPSKGGNFLGCGVKVGLITPLWKRGGRGDLLMISRKRLHPVGNTGLINAIELLGLPCRLKNDLFVLIHSELFPDRQEHIYMLSVRRAMRFP